MKESEDIRLLFHGDRCSLVIQEAFPEDVGQYKVVAMNSAGEASTSCHVNVFGKLKVASNFSTSFFVQTFLRWETLSNIFYSFFFVEVVV